MDHRSFDLLSRAVALGGTRRRLLGALAGLTASGFAVGPRAVLADTSDDGGAGGTVACVPRPGLLQTSAPAQSPLPALITKGTRDSPNVEDAVALFDAVPGGVTAEGDPVSENTVGAGRGRSSQPKRHHHPYWPR